MKEADLIRRAAGRLHLLRGQLYISVGDDPFLKHRALGGGKYAGDVLEFSRRS